MYDSGNLFDSSPEISFQQQAKPDTLFHGKLGKRLFTEFLSDQIPYLCQYLLICHGNMVCHTKTDLHIIFNLPGKRHHKSGRMSKYLIYSSRVNIT